MKKFRVALKGLIRFFLETSQPLMIQKTLRPPLAD